MEVKWLLVADALFISKLIGIDVNRIHHLGIRYLAIVITLHVTSVQNRMKKNEKKEENPV